MSKLALLGGQAVCDFKTEPFHRFRQPERELIQKHLRALGPVKS